MGPVGRLLHAERVCFAFSLDSASSRSQTRALSIMLWLCPPCPTLFLCALQYLSTAEYAIREELTLKIAVLAEKFAPNLRW